MKQKRTTALALLAATALTLGACTADEANLAEPPSPSDSSTMPHTPSPGHDEHAGKFGEVGDPAQADRIIKIAALDSLAFDPPSISVKTGETITFEVVGSEIGHDFTIGDEATQESHGEAMMSGSMEHHDDNAVTVPPGETVRMTWTFTEAGTFLYGCHVPGHYDAGMKGTITVAGKAAPAAKTSKAPADDHQGDGHKGSDHEGDGHNDDGHG